MHHHTSKFIYRSIHLDIGGTAYFLLVHSSRKQSKKLGALKIASAPSRF